MWEREEEREVGGERERVRERVKAVQFVKEREGEREREREMTFSSRDCDNERDVVDWVYFD